ncbi:MAG: PAS domain-containing protein [Mangrovibacterium sp.]
MKEEYGQLTKEELFELLNSRDRLLEALKREKDEDEMLQFPWVGNLGQWFWDVKANLVTFNPLKVLNLGYERAEIPEDCNYQFFTEKLHPDDYEPVMQNMRNHLLGKSDVYEVEYRIKTTTGQWKWYYDRGKVTRRENSGEPLFVAGIVFDITERKSLEEKQQILIRSLSTQMNLHEKLFSTIMHDLRNPLANVISLAALLSESLEQKSVSGELTDLVQTILQSANQAFDITRSMLDWTKIKNFETGNADPVVLHTTAAEVIREFEQEVNLKKLAVRNEIPEEEIVLSNKTVLTIALRNFLSNAVKYSNPGGLIRFTFQGRILSVIDLGVGMDPDKQASLFSSVIKSSLGTNREAGNGVGLILVKELLDRTNIDLTLISAAGEGTTVELRFNEMSR